MSNPTDEFIVKFGNTFESSEFLKIVLSAPSKSATAETPRKQTVRTIELKGKNVLQWELQFDKKQTHQNLSLKESVDRFTEQFGKQFREAYLFFNGNEWILKATKKGIQLKKKSHKASAPTQSQHNKLKNYLIPEGTPCSFLEALGIMNSDGKVHASRQKKFRQVNRYLEIINDLYKDLPQNGPIHIVDFGCGLSYLTFGVHFLLNHIHEREVILHGIDQKKDVIERCQNLASQLNLKGIVFSNGKIEEAEQAPKVHLALSLHACDTATDAALTFAVRADADVILAVPCCQHEVFPQIDSEILQLILKHGILKERLSSLATDALRASALEAAGYKAQIMEFIDLEHTPKNLLIRAVKRSNDNRVESEKAYQELKEHLNIQHLATDQIIPEPTI